MKGIYVLLAIIASVMAIGGVLTGSEKTVQWLIVEWIGILGYNINSRFDNIDRKL